MDINYLARYEGMVRQLTTALDKTQNQLAEVMQEIESQKLRLRKGNKNRNIDGICALIKIVR